ncbi:olfactory receptor 51I2-like [Aquarana catesbeiana]|uniref:olfactory receptor 51I2-like n=1 Tax=Aquarana catesbeiana TaxID=8400 RepID=UPI003CC9D047
MEGLSQNRTSIFYNEFVLFGFPGIIRYRKLLVLPFLLIYITILAGNLLVLHQIFIEPKLHSPMYFLMSILFIANISSTTSVLPKFLVGLCLDMNQIPLVGCLCQMFFIYFLGGFESGVIMMMALDRFVAIHKPLLYNNIMTKTLIVQLVLIGTARSMLFTVPTVTLTSSIHFCRSNIILNFVCENMGLLSLACTDISKVQLLGLMIKSFITITDVGFLLVSYFSILHTVMVIITGEARHKALHTCICHIVTATLIYICSLLASIVYRMHMHISYDFKNLFNAIYLLVPAALNPLVYGIGVKEIRSSIVKTWKKQKYNLFILSMLQGQKEREVSRIYF